MDDKKDQDLANENKLISNKIYQYFYVMLKDKREINFFVIYILYILETIQLISYGFSEPHIDIWKEKDSTIKTISDIIGISRITALMKYIKFNIYLIIFFILIIFTFTLCIFLFVQILFFKESKLFINFVNIIKNLIYPLSIFMYIPIIELLLLPMKCNSENKVEMVKEGIKCWENTHYFYYVIFF